ncbi:MAG: hypothetical protein AB7F50_06165 [Fimbriimonadaceae bacterium]
MFLGEAVGRWGVFVSGCLIWIPIAVWVVAIIHMWVGGDIEAPFAVAAIFVGLAIIALTVRPPVDWLSPVLFAGTIVTMVLFVPIRRLAMEHELKEMDGDRLERALDACIARPDNAASKLAAAEILFKHGQVAHAAALAESALAGANPAHFRTELTALAKWKAIVAKTGSEVDPCIRCGVKTLPGTLDCARCGAPVMLDSIRGRVVKGELMHKLVAAWAIGTLVVVGVPAVFGYLGKTPVLAGIGVLAIAALAIVIGIKGRVLGT